MPGHEIARPSFWENAKMLFTVIVGLGVFALIGRSLLDDEERERTNHARFLQATQACAEVEGRDYAGCIQQQTDTLERKAYEDFANAG